MFAEETFPRAFSVPSIRPLGLERLGNALIDRRILEDLSGTVGGFAHKYGDRHAPGTLPRDHPVGAIRDHAVDTVLALRRHPARRLDGGECSRAQRVAGLRAAA